MRGIAALLVVAYHLQFGAAYRLGFEEATPFFRRGYLWVDLFFILSGFIISYSNDAERETLPSKTEAKRFLSSRFMRIYPLHIICLAAYVLCAAAISATFVVSGREPPFPWDGKSLSTIAAQALLVNAWFASLDGWNIPTWSISAEFAAYMLFPLLVGFHARSRHASEAIMLALASAFMIAIGISSGSLDVIAGVLAPCRCIAGFMLGMLIFYHRSMFSALSWGTLSLLQAVSAAGIAALLVWQLSDPLIVPFFMLLVGTSWTDRGPIPWLLTHRPFLWLGEISYSIYLIHVPLLKIASLGWPHLSRSIGLSAALDRALWLVLVTAAVVGVASLTYRRIERPARQWLAERWLGHRLPPIETSPGAP